MAFIPNTTPTPNWLYNGEMKKMNETELKVVLLVTRKTLGWFNPDTQERKTQDYISQSQFIEFTGQSNRAIATAIQVCVRHGWIIAKDRKGTLCNTPEKRRRRKVWYQLGTVFTDKISSEESSLDEENDKKSSEQNDINLVKKVHNTKETITKENLISDGQAVAGIPEVLKVFEKVNPAIKRMYGNKTQRASAENLIKQFGLDMVLKAAEAAMNVLGQPYAPKITTPYQLETEWAKLVAFYKEHKNKNLKVVL